MVRFRGENGRCTVCYTVAATAAAGPFPIHLSDVRTRRSHVPVRQLRWHGRGTAIDGVLMDIVPAIIVHGLVPGGALEGSRRRGWWSCGRTGVGEAGATDPAPVGDVAVGAPRCAVAVAVAGAIVGLARYKVTGARAEVGGWESDRVNHRGCDGEREGEKPSDDHEAMQKSHSGWDCDE